MDNLNKALTLSRNQITLMQTAWIEWKRGNGAETAMNYIEAYLEKNKLIPKPTETNAIKFYTDNMEDK